MDYMRNDITDELNAPTIRKRGPRYAMRSDDAVYPILRMERDGFTIAAERAPSLRGFVDILLNEERIARCLIFCVGSEHGVVSYGFKRMTADGPPSPTDFVVDVRKPVALLS
jgi:hypothetical protein